MRLLASLNEMRSCFSGSEDSIDSLSDNLYLLLNRDKIQKLSAMKLNDADRQRPIRGFINRYFADRRICVVHQEGI